MGRARPERILVEEAYKHNRKRKAHEIAREIGLLDEMGYDKAVDYVKRVKRSMKEKGDFPTAHFASDKERLADLRKLVELREYTLSEQMAFKVLMMHCYYQLRDRDDDTHLMAIDDTYALNAKLKEPLHMSVAIRICEIALEHYMRSRDEKEIEKAKKRGLPGAGLNYTDETFIEKLAITQEELAHMTSIKGG